MYKILSSLLALLCCLQIVLGKRVVCYYDSESANRTDVARLPLHEIDVALQYCTHLIYGYAGLTQGSYEITSLNVDLDVLKALKAKFPYLRIYLSLGGDRDQDPADDNKYIHFLEGGKQIYYNFIQSSISLLRTNGFDGLDLAFQFPRNKPRKVHSAIGMVWKKLKKVFTGNFIVDKEAEIHKQQFTEFVDDLHHAYTIANLSMTLTVLPNVNSTWYFDIPKIYNLFEYINLFAFDFLTPERNPDEADYTAPTYLYGDKNRLLHYSVDFQVQHWIDHGCPPDNLNLGIATYGRAWKTSTDSGLTGVPVVPATLGPAHAGLQSKKKGLLSFPEVCLKKKNTTVCKVHIDTFYGNYAFCRADKSNEYVIWISYDDPYIAGAKTMYAKKKGLGGVAVVDISYDDFRGNCTGDKYPILSSVKSCL